MRPPGSALSSVRSLAMSHLVVANVRISGSDLPYKVLCPCPDIPEIAT